MSDLKKQAGDLIKKARKERGLTQKELGELIGVSESMASRIENGKQNLTLETLEKTSAALGIDLLISRK